MSQSSEPSRKRLLSEEGSSQSNAKKTKDISESDCGSFRPIYMAMKNGSKVVNKSFKVPELRVEKPLGQSTDSSRTGRAIDVSNPAHVRQSIDRLKGQISQTDQKIKQLSEQGFKLDDLDEIVDKLHDYNEIKDATQHLLERLAHIHGVTIKKMHQIYNLDVEYD